MIWSFVKASIGTINLELSASYALQDMQADMAILEKQLRSVKQERNALAATLRQHGFLGKQSRSNNAFGASGHEQQQESAQADLCRQSAQMSYTEHGGVGNSSDIIQPSGSNVKHQPAQEARSKDARATPSPALTATKASCNTHLREARCLRDTTNVVDTTLASPAGNLSSHPAGHVLQQSDFEAESPTYAGQQGSKAMHA